jgi:hypothetical protein
MTTITINPKTKAGKTLLDLANILAINDKEIKLNNSKSTIEDKNIYNQDFVEMVLKASKSKTRTVIDPKDLWGSLGLK